MPKVMISCPVYPSEDPDKVSAAILRIFPDAVLEASEKGLHGTCESLGEFSRMIRRQKILDTARSVLLRGTSSDRIVFYLNKQVATVGKVSFTEERTILGSIRVTVENPEPSVLVDSVAPFTVDGQEVRI
ncbi:MAG: RNA-binding domain-containing protein [Candidatus Methanomethylophilaceae archaeon]|jgi:predicted RNA binding protein with dsRBD fold (UPF0201 family)|nr:RNA-binding domain-containing protein [Candidatus Methanomethylophilaceae archaeon]NLF33359.1 hypothetical protein [Thermoplasmatales archaeon]